MNCSKKCYNRKRGAKSLSFCINAGPAFVIGTVGSEMLGSVKAGVLLYISTVSASFLPVSFQLLCMIKRRRKRVKAKFRLHFATLSELLYVPWVTPQTT